MQTIELAIRGMPCAGCAARLRGLLAREPGVRQAEVSFRDGLARARVRVNKHATSRARLIEVIEHAGFEVSARS